MTTQSNLTIQIDLTLKLLTWNVKKEAARPFEGWYWLIRLEDVVTQKNTKDYDACSEYVLGR